MYQNLYKYEMASNDYNMEKYTKKHEHELLGLYDINGQHRNE